MINFVDKFRNRQIAGRFLPPLAWIVFIFVLTSIPSKQIVSVSLIGLDKIVHLIIYAPLGYLLARAIYFGRFFSLMVVFVLCLAISACDEIHQIWIAGRDSSIGDFIADVIGSVAGIIIFRYRFYKWRNKSPK